MKKILSSSVVLFLIFSFQLKAQNPYDAIGKKTTMLTLTKGKYPEYHVYDSIQRIGSVLMNIKRGTIIKLLERNSLAVDPEIATRWWSVDPMAHERASWTPYNYCSNNPILRIDPDGALDGDYYAKDGTYLGSDGKNDDKVYTVENGSYSSTPDGSKSVVMQSGVTELKNADGTSFSHAQFKALAGTLYAESTPGSTNSQEAAGIYSVMENRANAVGVTPYEIASNPSTYGVYGWSERDKINSPFAPKASVQSAYRGLIAGMTESTDFSGGGTYWHGKDFGMSNKPAYKSFYKVGFDFTNSSHDTWKLGDRKSGNSSWDFKYQSTGAVGGTTFMKLTEGWKKAVRYNHPY